MKTLLISFLLVLSITSANAQEWQMDINKAKEIATAKNQNIILVFQGSDWCSPCIKLEKEIWNSEVFIDYSEDNFVLLKADFPRREKNKLSEEQQKKNSLLAEKYNTQGFFPLVVVLDFNGKVLGMTGYEKVTPKKYIKILTSF
ncbi:MAG: thioredoxin family protein [Melioribacteraceae bacterium]